MRKISRVLVLIVVLVLIAGCGDDPDAAPDTAPPTATEAMADRDDGGSSTGGDGGSTTGGGRPEGTKVVLGDSEFGEMLYDAGDQAIYVFERDRSEESSCYGECAAAWPPVLTTGMPVAGDGVDESLLGTTERRDGSTQLTYGGRPLYFYAHEEPGEVRCHNVDLNGGLWWVVGADGEPLA